MPLYEYKCNQCGELFSKLVNLQHADAITCPACQSADIAKQLSTFNTSSTTASPPPPMPSFPLGSCCSGGQCS